MTLGRGFNGKSVLFLGTTCYYQMGALFTQRPQNIHIFRCPSPSRVTPVSQCSSLSLFPHNQMGWRPSLSSSGPSSARRTSSSGWPARNTRPSTPTRSCCPKPNTYTQFLLNRTPLKRYGMACWFIAIMHGCSVATYCSMTGRFSISFICHRGVWEVSNVYVIIIKRSVGRVESTTQSRACSSLTFGSGCYKQQLAEVRHLAHAPLQSRSGYFCGRRPRFQRFPFPFREDDATTIWYALRPCSGSDRLRACRLVWGFLTFSCRTGESSTHTVSVLDERMCTCERFSEQAPDQVISREVVM